MVVRGPDGVEQLGTALKFRDEPCEPRGAVRGLGEHGDEVLEWLRYEEAERWRLHEEGVV
jgi:crotonobetainyl-CoA:carnitine CoA-transferase CaiB-like acyl-CoA transferase